MATIRRTRTPPSPVDLAKDMETVAQAGTARVLRRAPPVAPSKAYVPAEDEDKPVAKVDYAAVIKRYQDKVTNRASAIRAKCVECSGGALSEVKDCPITKCALHPYRMGIDPGNKKTKERMEREAMGSNGEEDAS